MKKIFKIFKLIGIVGAVAIGIISYKKKNEEVKKEKDQWLKMASYYMLFNKWMKLKEEGRNTEDYFIKNNIHNIAIYGYKELGERLYSELKNTPIEVKYIIDKNIDKVRAEIDVYSPDEELPEVDAIIVTATHFYDEIEDELSDLVECQIISLADVII